MRGRRCDNCFDFAPSRRAESVSASIFGPNYECDCDFDLSVKAGDVTLDFCSWACLSAYAEKCAKEEARTATEAETA